jgi:hypothetical protein
MLFSFIEHEFSTSKVCASDLSKKTKDHQITEGSSAHLMRKGEDDAFQFYRTRILNKQSVRKRSPKLKTKDHQITKLSSTHLTLKGEGDTFHFRRTLILNGKSHEGDLKNQKTETVSSLKPAPLNQCLKVRVTLFALISNVKCQKKSTLTARPLKLYLRQSSRTRRRVTPLNTTASTSCSTTN